MAAPAIRRGAVLGLLCAVALTAGLAVWLFGAPANPAVAGIGGPFALTDGNGQTVTDRSFRGRYMLVYFGYTFCPDVCPTTLNSVAEALDLLGPKADRVAPLFITVDPARDTPAVVRDYAAAFGKRLTGLTGTPEQIAAVAREYRVYYTRHDTGPNPGDYSMDHSSVLYLMAPDGTFDAVIRADGPPAAIADALSRHIS